MIVLPDIPIIFGGAVLGLVFGSFVTALTFRLPRGESVSRGRSRCPTCAHDLTARDLVPVLSWVVTRGSCRHCRASISARYPTIELVSVVLFVCAAATVRDPVNLLLLFAFSPIMLALAVVDFEHQQLPNLLIVALVPLAVAWRWQSGFGMPAGLAAAAVTFAGLLGLDALHRLVTRQSGLGSGDAKLISLAAFSLPLPVFLVCLAAAGGSGILLALWWRRHTGQDRFPFGITILFAWWLCLVIRVPALP